MWGWGRCWGDLQRGAAGARGGIRLYGGRQLPVRLAEVGVPHRQVGVAARSACGGSLAALVLGGHAQGRNRPLEPTDGCQHDARGVEGMDPGLPASPVAPGVGHRLGVDFHVQDVRRHLGPDR